MDNICRAGKPVPTVKAVIATPDYTLHLTFANGERRIYDAVHCWEKISFHLYGSPPFSSGPFLTAAPSLGTTI